MHLQSLKLLRPTVMIRCFYNKKTTFGLGLGVKCHMRSLYHMTCAPANFEVAASKGVEDDAFTLKKII